MYSIILMPLVSCIILLVDGKQSCGRLPAALQPKKGFAAGSKRSLKGGAQGTDLNETFPLNALQRLWWFVSPLVMRAGSDGTIAL